MTISHLESKSKIVKQSHNTDVRDQWLYRWIFICLCRFHLHSQNLFGLLGRIILWLAILYLNYTTPIHVDPCTHLTHAHRTNTHAHTPYTQAHTHIYIKRKKSLWIDTRCLFSNSNTVVQEWVSLSMNEVSQLGQTFDASYLHCSLQNTF